MSLEGERKREKLCSALLLFQPFDYLFATCCSSKKMEREMDAFFKWEGAEPFHKYLVFVFLKKIPCFCGSTCESNLGMFWFIIKLDRVSNYLTC